MGILDTLKDAVTLIQKADNIELTKTIIDLQSQVIALIEENRGLKAKLVTGAQLAFNKNAYWLKETSDGPFCSPCWDSGGKLMRLHLPSAGTVGSPWCPVCKQYAVDPDKERSAHQRMREGRTGGGPEPPLRGRDGY